MFKPLLRQLFALVCLTSSVLSTVAFATDDISIVGRMVFGDNPLKPSPESLLGKYLAETGERNFVRSFPYGANGGPGPERLVVFVSELTFPIFQKYFTGPNFLYHFHEPHTHSQYVAFNGKRGTKGRLQDSFRYNYAGVLAIPVLLTDDEGKRAEQFFNLALKVSRKNDVALYPWLLTNDKNEPYCKKGSDASISDWVVRMPIGKLENERNFEPYDLSKITSDAIRTDIQTVWNAPYGHKSLAQTINLPELENQAEKLTPGRLGAALLGSANADRVPVVFRFTDSVPEKPVVDTFDTYFDLEFEPAPSVTQ